MGYEETSLVDTINKWVIKGFTENFRIEGGKILSSSTPDVFKPDEVSVECTHRFDGMTNPGDDCILIVIKTQTGLKGTLVVPYGAKTGLDEVIREL